MPFEVQFMIWLQSISADWFIKLNDVLSMFGEELVMVAILGAVYWGFNKKVGEFLGFTLLSANTFNAIVKNIVARNRPYMDNPEIISHKPIANGDINDPLVQGYSFPSGHSQSSATLYTSLAIKGKKKWLIIIAVAVPLLVAFSRIVLGVHYPTDVLAGLALGVTFAFGLNFLFKVVKNKYYIYIGMCVVACSGLFFAKSDDYFTSLGMLIGFVCSVYFEEKVVKFENTKLWWRIVIRIIVGGALFLAIGAVLKPLFNLIAEDNNYLRIIRYAITVFLCMGVYPLSFNFATKLYRKWNWIKD